MDLILSMGQQQLGIYIIFIMSQSIIISLKQAIIGNQEEEDKLFNLYAYMHKETLKLIS